MKDAVILIDCSEPKRAECLPGANAEGPALGNAGPMTCF